MQSIVKALGVAALAVALGTVAGADEIRGAGSTFAAPLIEAWGEARAGTGLTLGYEAVGSGEGLRAFAAGEVDFGATERPMRDADIEAIPGGVFHVPVTASMVAVAYNLPGIEGQLRLGRGALAGIFSGAVTAWNDPVIVADNPGIALPDRDIALVTRRDASGTSFAFSGHLAAADREFAETGPGVDLLPAWPGRAMTAYGNEGVASRLALAQYSIGYVEYGFAARLGLPVAALENAAGQFVAPTPEAGAAALAAEAEAMPPDGRQLIADPAGAAAYPVVSYTWVLLRADTGDAAKAALLRDFFGWATGAEGQAIAADKGYVPLPMPVAERAASMMEAVR